jgi:DNA-binding NtrC family response regulator
LTIITGIDADAFFPIAAVLRFAFDVDHVRTALSKPTLVGERAELSLGAYAEELLAAARRGELADPHARMLDAAEREPFRRAIYQAQGNQAKAARWLGVSSSTLKAKLVQFGLHPTQDGAQGE